MAKKKKTVQENETFDPLIHTDVVSLNPQELEATLDSFGQYVHGYDQCIEDGGDEDQGTKDMIEGWEVFVRCVGRRKALQVFWCWARTLPEFKTGMCNPDGN